MTDNLTDQGLAQLMASLGYPVPQSINQGRTSHGPKKSNGGFCRREFSLGRE